MKKNLLLLYTIFCILHSAFSQTPGEWTWMRGVQGGGYAGSFGTQGVPSPTNDPPCLYEGCEWTDQQGNLWLYGGQQGGAIYYSDLWKYTPSTNEWTWVNGPGITSQAGVYGTQGVSSPLNTPGARGWAPTSWTDANNNLWMFGGNSTTGGDMNDLWMYNISTNEWTWMKGSNTGGSNGNAGTQGVPALTNEPACRHENACGWVDNSNRLWLFGGFGGGQTDDLWQYDISTNMWTWMKGTPLVASPTVWGTRGVPAPANTPGSRNTYSRWKDANGNFWLFGGIEYSAGSYNDLWMYDIGTNNWTWMKGPNVADDSGVYGAACTEDSTFLPPARFENRSCWKDTCGNFWMFGGATVVGAYPTKNDLWKYSVATNNWTFVNGSTVVNDPGNYGTLGVSASTNIPPSRFGSLSWTDQSGYMWMFGGNSSGSGFDMGDFWRFVPDPSCGGCLLALPVANFVASDTTICPGSCVDFTNLSMNATTYSWLFPGATPASDSAANPTNICYANSGIYTVSLTASDGVGLNTYSATNYINVFPAASPPVITQLGDTLFATQTFTSYQWFYGSDSIAGATNYFYVATLDGNYNLIVTDENGCSVGAGIINVVTMVQSAVGNWQLAIYPNPTNGQLAIGNRQLAIGEIEICNALGEIVYKEQLNTKYKILNTNLAAGIYLLKISSGEKIFTEKIVIEK